MLIDCPHGESHNPNCESLFGPKLRLPRWILPHTRQCLVLDLETRCLEIGLCEEFKVTNIYVGNLSFRATEDDVRGAFAAHGDVSSVNIIMDRETGRSRGFAFVEMPNADEANSAIDAINGQEIAGRGVTVNEARPRTDRPRGGGGGGGGRYSDDRGGRGRSYSRD